MLPRSKRGSHPGRRPNSNRHRFNAVGDGAQRGKTKAPASVRRWPGLAMGCPMSANDSTRLLRGPSTHGATAFNDLRGRYWGHRVDPRTRRPRKALIREMLTFSGTRGAIAIAVALTLESYTDPAGVAKVAAGTLAADTGICLRSVQAALRELAARGVIIASRNRGASLYRFNSKPTDAEGSVARTAHIRRQRGAVGKTDK